jgi:hypothetical protein
MYTKIYHTGNENKTSSFFAETEDSQLAPKSKVYLATNPLKLTYSSSDKYILTFHIKTMFYVLTYCHI